MRSGAGRRCCSGPELRDVAVGPLASLSVSGFHGPRQGRFASPAAMALRAILDPTRSTPVEKRASGLGEWVAEVRRSLAGTALRAGVRRRVSVSPARRAGLAAICRWGVRVSGVWGVGAFLTVHGGCEWLVWGPASGGTPPPPSLCPPAGKLTRHVAGGLTLPWPPGIPAVLPRPTGGWPLSRGGVLARRGRASRSAGCERSRREGPADLGPHSSGLLARF